MTEDTPYRKKVRGIVLLVPRTIYKIEHIGFDVLKLSTKWVFCHREPVTDVTGVAIRILKALKIQLF